MRRQCFSSHNGAVRGPPYFTFIKADTHAWAVQFRLTRGGLGELQGSSSSNGKWKLSGH